MRKSFKQPDLNAPRFRHKHVSLLNRKLYDRFIKRFPEYKHLTLNEFKEIVKVFNGKITEGVIHNRDGVELPEGLGFIFMGSCPPAKSQNINVEKSLKYGVITNHKNWDSDNKLLKIFYTNKPSKYPFQNKQVWAFKAVKQFRKAASEAFKENWASYIVVDNTRKISSMYAKLRKKDYVLQSSAEVPEDWDEFNL